MSIEDDIRTAVSQAPRDEEFERLRAHVRGTVIDAHRQLIGQPFEWLTTDDRILDILTAWIDQCRHRGRS